ncbi:hypothetical protein G7Y89_g11064 [Cudoniella acicularis]|uniref:Protein kinase domain-containing protein n=1 Tax=Cudoniella acicularis TaxID=354080 RepID=A0A8H4RBK2_9HELO|nr:hypothetical protein G7Y89_g11064 [Cudoniella acicularis]
MNGANSEGQWANNALTQRNSRSKGRKVLHLIRRWRVANLGRHLPTQMSPYLNGMSIRAVLWALVYAAGTSLLEGVEYLTLAFPNFLLLCQSLPQTLITDTPSEKMKPLRSRIMEKMERQGDSSERFVADNCLKELICEPAVAAALERYKSGLKTEISELASFVCNGARRVFAILVWSECEILIEQFYKNGFKDEMLPVKVQFNGDGDWKVESSGTKSANLKVVDAVFNRAPVFGEKEFRYMFHKQCRMPFLNYTNQKESNFSVVEEWIIHQDHLQIDSPILVFYQGIPIDGRGYRVAVKELKKLPRMSDAEFKVLAGAEAQALEMIRKLRHPHLIKAIAYYTKGPKHYFMFPWAGRGNLRDLWEKDPPEAELFKNKSRSRRYDIWSIGCVYLEFVIWLLYGSTGLSRFRGDLGSRRFYDIPPRQSNETKTAQISDKVQKWVDWIRKDLCCPENTALRHLVELIVSRLLVVEVHQPRSPPPPRSILHEAEPTAGSGASLPPIPSIIQTSTSSTQFGPADTPSAQHRATALEMYKSIEAIFKDASSSTSRIEWMKWDEQQHQQGPRQFGEHLAPSHAGTTGKPTPCIMQNLSDNDIAHISDILWIDSLCIIQDDPHDWDMESKIMEQVFSSAYATIAASCASGTEDGFLKTYPERQCVTKGSGSDALYLCGAIDDFRLDVDQGELNNRGWVLQERALSRRTIYFTENQSYWECGEGVRCETLTKMKNRKASFLGDANFPHSVEAYVKGMKIQLFQDLYERYSNLALSFNTDRPIAIKGLETRLIRTLKTIGGYGIFDCYLHRSLLWQRSGSTLKRITSFHGEHVPSWSWMAYDGGILYMDIPFGGVLWAKNITSPFKIGALDGPNDGNERVMPLEMEASVWDIVEPQSPQLILDDPSRAFAGPLKCVIMGTSTQSKSDESQRHYTLIVSSLAREEEAVVYERVGVGFLERRHIMLDKPEIVHYIYHEYPTASAMALEKRQLNVEDYTVVWIVAIKEELAAVTKILDERDEDLPQLLHDSNSYTLGRIGKHNVVIACMPEGALGTTWASTVATNMACRFPCLRFGLMVGVAGGVPSENNDIRLGDVVLSKPEGQHGGALQYNFGKAGKDGKVTRTGWQNAPPTILLTALKTLHTNDMIGELDILEKLALFNKLPLFKYPGASNDALYKSSYDHIPGPACAKCDASEMIQRPKRGSGAPVLHYGTIASDNFVMKDAATRDKISGELGGVLCFEMEAAGLMNTFPCLIIRGICHYSDSHKNKGWQGYAAAAAAVVAKTLLELIPSSGVVATLPVREVVDIPADQLSSSGPVGGNSEQHISQGGVGFIGDTRFYGNPTIGGYTGK